ncbi:MAG TPA: four helix bundle protein [Chthoniobacterales bacterium]|jgi:four helix bundle protein|nr:four helix bundle protein [Chthoniobacterales bacterium]
MARVNDFPDFDAFKACRAFVRETGLLVRTPSFAPNRSLANQMERASISVLSNFAEGYERDGNAEFIQFLSVSKGSVGELRAQLIYSLDIGLVLQSRYEELDIMGISAGGLSRYLAGSEKRGRKYDRRPKTANKR